jgi:hypothetical protein
VSSVWHRYFGWRLARLGKRAVQRGLPPSWLGYRTVPKEDLEEHLRRHASEPGTGVEAIHTERTFANPLPRNVPTPEELPADRGWWGYSMRDVPGRRSGPTLLATLRNATVVPSIDPGVDEFRPAILTDEGSSLEMREISFRDSHARWLRSAPPPRVVESGTWILERVYDNHSHWLTAHLPKLVLLRDRGELDDVFMPPELTPTMASSLAMLGINPARFSVFGTDRPLRFRTLRVLSTDRFRPDLLRPVREALTADGPTPYRRVYISRERAARRRLLNEGDVWELLERAGFEKVFMEDLDFERQVHLMQEATAVVAPHGAGLTNIMFCPEETAVVEIADLGFPNPNFYALASAMGHRYWIVPADSVGDVHPLEKDMVVDLERIEWFLSSLEDAAGKR